MPANRNAAGQFIKGHSGNPAGRAKENIHVRDLLKQNSVNAAQKIIDLLNSDNDKIAFAAAQEILNRTEGKPLQTQQIEVGGNLDVRSQVRAILLERENERLRAKNKAENRDALTSPACVDGKGR